MERKQTMESMEIKKILVTGSDGYIGAVLTGLLSKEAYDVTGLDTGYYKSQKLGKYLSNIKIIKRDIRNQKDLSLKGFDAVVHLAALSNDPLGELDGRITEEINYKATIALARKAKREGVKRFIFSSSCSIYGIAKKGIVNEKSKVNPLTSYSKSKIMTEKMLKELADENFCVGLMRNSTVYGYSPKFRDDLVVNNMTACALATNQIRIMSDGTPWRPLIDIRDLSQIFIEFLKVDAKKINGKVINIGFNNGNYQVREIANLVKKNLKSCKIVYTGEHGSDTRSYKVDFSLFEKTFPDFKPKWSMDKSIKDLVVNLKKNKYSLKDFNSKKFSRIMVLKNLIKNKKLSNKLLWQ